MSPDELCFAEGLDGDKSGDLGVMVVATIGLGTTDELEEIDFWSSDTVELKIEMASALACANEALELPTSSTFFWSLSMDPLTE